ncbi:nitrogenase iron-molybdenum cofactor biosynthesis protein NifE [Roseospira marina]|uniref:Nitrogenase iron-molybdenum cofactor biosynthesis protein NifE n=1 Tax=Roseospira marina TaxID=140057 RepID=A0A5M6IID0_9PROT|nr:nitrogenase iron-molybdenum cofactor biosynthesis protein NifE [Roseospira marina]KAA5607619.1 nitrogenase iron-molybdenum cofactor biosynthesis protein NifE [Roseospira marina]MBB4312182.1 nitrogenase molybdenum-cofactor synthesis protein NifE [Roseospira marina]MBB5085802.1 nitrogenase molybdenum-cofactor synthesis protein NifE [Roseospira marina]
MLTDRLAPVFDEPGCATNRAKTDAQRKAGCKPKGPAPGAAAGGCAFDGAKISLQPIVDAAHIVHGPIACEGNNWDNRHSASSGSDLYRRGLTTDLTELDVIQGSEKKLWKAIRQAIEKFDPPAVFVYQTCVPALTGDDIRAVCAAATERHGRPVIPVEAPGFVGTKNLGNRLAGETLLEHVIGTREPETTTPTDICLIAEFNIVGDLWQITPLFEALGIRLLSCISGDARYNEVTYAHRARASMVVCSQAMVNVGRKLQERWGIPYFEGSFNGVRATSEALRTFARLLVEQGAPADLIDRTEALIAEKEAEVRRRFEPFRETLAGKKVLLYTGGNKSWAVVSTLQDMGMEVIGTSVRKSTNHGKDRARDLLGEEQKLLGAVPNAEMYRILREGEADIMLSGGRSQFVALNARRPWLDTNQERHHPYAGYEGFLVLAERLALTLDAPVWDLVNGHAPWEEGYTP